MTNIVGPIQSRRVLPCRIENSTCHKVTQSSEDNRGQTKNNAFGNLLTMLQALIVSLKLTNPTEYGLKTVFYWFLILNCLGEISLVTAGSCLVLTVNGNQECGVGASLSMMYGAIRQMSIQTLMLVYFGLATYLLLKCGCLYLINHIWTRLSLLITVFPAAKWKNKNGKVIGVVETRGKIQDALIKQSISHTNQKELGETDIVELPFVTYVKSVEINPVVELKDDVEEELVVETKLIDTVEEEFQDMVNEEYQINMWELLHKHKHFRFVYDGMKVHVRGTFKFSKKEEFVCGYFSPFNGTRKVVEYSTDKVLIKTGEPIKSPAQPTYLDGYDCIKGNKSQAIKLSCLAIIGFVDFRRDIDWNHLVYRAKQHYIKFWEDFVGLDAIIRAVLRSRWFRDQYNQFCAEDYTDYEYLLTTRCNALLKDVGETVDTVYSKWCIRTFSLGLFPILCFLWLCLLGPMFLDSLPLPLKSNWFWLLILVVTNKFLTVSLLCFSFYCAVRIWYPLMVIKPRVEYMKRLSGELDATVKAGMMPCTRKPVLKTIVFPYEKLPPLEDLRGDVKIRANYPLTDQSDYQPKDVIIHGTFIEGANVLYPDTSSEQNLDAAVRIRMSKDMPTVDVTVEKFKKFAMKFIDEMPEMDVSGVDNSLYVLSHYGSIMGASILEQAKSPLEAADFVFGLFTKGEAYVGKSAEDWKPRMIWSCPWKIIGKFSGYFNYLGKLIREWFKSLEMCYASGTSPIEVGSMCQLMQAKFPFICEGDVKNWDGSLSEIMLFIEQYFMSTKVKGMPDGFDVLVTNWTTVHGKNSKGNFEVEMEHGRRTGDLWTAMLNSLMNLILTCFCFQLKLGNFGFCVLGDDNVVFTPKKVKIEEVRNTYCELGMEIKIIPRDSLLDTEFCSGGFWTVDGQLDWGNFPFRMFAKLGIDLVGLSDKKLKRKFYTSCKSLMSTGRHVPILGTFIQAIVDSAEAQNLKRLKLPKIEREYLYKIHGGLVHLPGKDTYEQFSLRYNISVEAVYALEEWIECNVTIDDCPYKLTGEMFLAGFLKDAGLETVVPPEQSLMGFSDYEYYTKIVPEIEEKEKLVLGRGNFMNTLREAWIYGRDEDSENNNKGFISHAWLHALFSMLSFINFSWGVGLHGAFNHLAYVSGGCVRRKNRRRKKLVVQQVVEVKKQPRRRRKKKNKNKNKNRRQLGRYSQALLLPMSQAALGCKIPDAFGFPTCTARLVATVEMNTTTAGFFAYGFQPLVSNFAFTPAVVSGGGVITWSGGTENALPQFNSLFAMASAYRVVSWGIRLTSDQSAFNVEGHFWVAHVPMLVDNNNPFGSYPTIESGFDQLPLSAKFSCLSTGNEPLLVAGRRIDEGVNRFRNCGVDEDNNPNVAVESMTGWAAIVLMGIGMQTSAPALNVEYVINVEYLQKATGTTDFNVSAPEPFDDIEMKYAAESAMNAPVSLFDTPEDTTILLEQAAATASANWSKAGKIAKVLGTGVKLAYRGAEWLAGMNKDRHYQGYRNPAGIGYY